MNLGLTGKRVLVTGASRGIGAAIANQFLEEDANVLIVSRGSTSLFDTEGLLQAKYGASRVKAETCDCTLPSSLESLRQKVESTWKSLDIVVASVGDGRSVSDSLPDPMAWERSWNINFESALQTTRIVLPMLRQSKGCLLLISSIAGMQVVGAPTDYSTAKAAVIALAKNMASKLAQEVRINILAPGNVYFAGGSWDEKSKKEPDVVEKFIQSTVPMNRFGSPEEIADAAVFLCSERAKFITGSVLTVDGGQTVGVI